jgi:protein SCO1
MAISRVALALALATLLTPACRGKAADPRGAPRYPLRGRVVSVDLAERKITLAHEEIPGFMPAMTMPFVVLEKEAVLLPNVAPGDEITASLVVPDSRYWIEDLVVVKKRTIDQSAPPRPEAREPQPGDLLPDVSLVDQDGEAFHLSDYRGRALALTFVFTRCPFPDFCPLMMKNFAAAEAALLADERLRARTRLLTVSFDPGHDTPAVLRAWGGPYQKSRPPFTHWTLATGSVEAISTLGGALSLDSVEEDGTFTHNLRTAVVDPEGRLLRLYHGNDWTPDALVADLERAIGPGR